jgi:hypothetical protein
MGGYYNSTVYNCLIYNGTNPNYNGTIINPNEVTSPDTVYCPSETPYFNGSGCMDCNGSTPYFNQTS